MAERLRERGLEVRHAVVTSLAVVTPTAAIFFFTIPAAGNAGKAMPFAYLVAFAAVLLIVNAIARFARHVAHAGSFFAFVRAALGARTGFMAGWLFLAFYPLLLAFSLIIFGALIEQILDQHTDLHIAWWVLALIGGALIFVPSVLGIRLSIRTDLALLVFEGAVLGALGLTILLDGGADGVWHPEVFDPSNSPSGTSGIALAAVFGVLSFTGFEAASYLGEEAREPRRTIPRGMVITVLLAGMVYVVFSYIATIGYGVDDMGRYASDPAPWDTLAGRFWSDDASVVVDIAAAIAALAGGMAAQNGAARMVFALGRDGLLPGACAQVSRRFGTPHVALTALFAVAAAVALGFGFGYDPLPAFALLGLVVTFNALAVYFLAQVACIVYFWRRGGFSPLWHGIVPLAAMAVIVYLFYHSAHPTPPHPQNLAIWLALGWAGAGLAIVAALSVGAPERFRRMAAIIGEEGEPA